MADPWKTVEVLALRRAGNWITGIAVQERNGEKRIKLFKGRISEKGRLEVEYKGKKYRVSMVQRINIPSKKYWEWLKREMDLYVDRFLGGQKTLE